MLFHTQFSLRPEVNGLNVLAVDIGVSLRKMVSLYLVCEYKFQLTKPVLCAPNHAFVTESDAFFTNAFAGYEGAYDSAVPPNTGAAATVQPIFRAGFDRKENKYCANLINNTQANFATQGAIGGEVIYGDQISGIKGFTTLVTIQTDGVTDVGGYKELFTVSSNYTYSSGY